MLQSMGLQIVGYNWVTEQQSVKSLPAMKETQILSLGWKDPLEREMATQSSILAWKILWTEKPGGLQSMRLKIWAQLSN